MEKLRFNASSWRTVVAVSALSLVMLRTAVRADEPIAQPAAPAFPYVAYVTDAQAVIRSGPGKSHYATSQLTRGFAVEVYRHDGDGWCAVRPPVASFSLVPTRQLRFIDQRTAQVTGARVPARVGSSLVAAHDAVQVMLAAGEAVELIEPPTPTSPSVRIAPPTGEFRWIAATSLSRAAPVEGERMHALREVSDGKSGSPFAHLVEHSASTDAALRAALFSTDAPENEGEPALVDDLGAVAIVPGSPAAVQLADHEAGISTSSDVEAPPLGASPPGVPPSAIADSMAEPTTSPSGIPRIRFAGQGAVRSLGPLDPRVAEMDLRLSKIVADVPDHWQFSGLRDEAAALLAGEPTPEVRGQLRDLLARVERFETIQTRRHDVAAGRIDAQYATSGGFADDGTGMTGASGEVRARIREDLGGGASSLQGHATGGPSQALYDAVGTLKPVVSRRPQAPRFALVDDRGEVVSLVTPPPDIDMQQYVGQRVGVNGSRGFMTDLRRAHVTATRITPLDEKLVR